METKSLIIALGLLAERLEGASNDRPQSEDVAYLQAADQQAISIAHELIKVYNEQDT